MTAPIGWRSTSTPRASPSSAIVDLRHASRGPARRCGAGAGPADRYWRHDRRHERAAARDGRADRPCRGRPCQRPRDAVLRHHPDVRGLDTLHPSLLAIARTHRLRRDQPALPARRGPCRRSARSGRAGGCSASRRRCATAVPPVRGGAPDVAVEGEDAWEAGGFSGALPQPGDGARAKAFVDFQNDVTAKDIKLATREGFRSIEHIKRYTTTGMATDQGKTSNLNAPGDRRQGAERAGAGRGPHHLPPALHPRHLRHLRRPLARRAVRSRANDADPRLGGEARRGVRGRERLETRPLLRPTRRGHARRRAPRMPPGARDGGGCSTLPRSARSRSSAPTAAEFLNRLYPNSWTKLGVGRCRYGLMLNEAGFVMDDGVVGRMGPERFHVTTTTGGAPRRARPHGGLPPDRVSRSKGLADLDHRPMGRHRRAGAARARHPGAADRRHQTSPPAPSRTWRCARAASGACPPACSG